MKNTIKIFGIATLYIISIGSFISCGNSGNNQQQDKSMEVHEQVDEHNPEHEHANYICPMKCEGDKTYHESGKCPECEMELVKVEETEKQNHDEQTDDEHQDHNH